MHTLLELGGARVEEAWTELPHGRMLHVEAGEGKPLILLQGAGGGAANWYRLLARLSGTRRVLAPELPGFGLSEPVAPRSPLGAQAADVMLSWLEARDIDERFDVVATSFGGLVALRLALAAPERVHRIVLLNSVGLGRGLAWPVRCAGLPLVRDTVRSPSRRGTALLFDTLLTSDRSQLPAEHRDAIIEYTWRTARLAAGAELATALWQFADLRGQREVLGPDELRRIEAPVRILWGAADRFLPCRHGIRAAGLIPRATCDLLTRVGHSPNWEAPDRVLEATAAFLP